MKLATFITASMEAILIDWERFALTVSPEGQETDRAVLRDHGKEMLEAIALDLSESETEAQKSAKSKGNGPQHDSAAKTHGADRLALGLSLNSAVAEFRALRAGVIHLWQEEFTDWPSANRYFEDLIRFNEAIDQAITESVTSYSAQKDQQTRLFDTILSTSPDLTFTHAPAGELTFGNKALLDYLRLSREDVLGKDWIDLVQVGGPELQGHVRAVIAHKETLRGEIVLAARDGAQVTFDWIFVPVLAVDRQLECVAGTMRDITDRKNAEDKNWRKANHDELTGLPNRSLFLDRLNQAVLYAARTGIATALLFIDLDRFKEVNDSFGHGVGDLLLKSVAERLRACVRASDTVARLGGDEFTIVLQDVSSLDDVQTVAEKIVRELSNVFHLDGNEVRVAASVGISFWAPDATAKSLMNNADSAMYIAKSTGRSRAVLYSPDQTVTRGESLFGRL